MIKHVFEKIFAIVCILSFLSILFYSCGKRIQIESYLKSNNIWKMFGQTSERKFFINDSLKLPLKIKFTINLKAGLNFSSVTTMDNYIFVADLKGNIYRIDMNNGKILNFNPFKQPILTSIVLRQNELIFPLANIKGKNSSLIVYDLIKGEEKSKIVVDGSIENEILELPSSLILTTTKGIIYKLNRDYSLDWKIDLGSQICSHPAGNENIIVTARIDGTVVLVSQNGKIIDRTKIKHPIMSGFTIDGDLVYFADDGGILYSYDTQKKNFVFSKKLESSINAIPSIDNEYIFVGDLKGNIYCLKKENGELVWAKNYGGIIRNSILIVGDKLIVPNYQKRIFILNKYSGELLQEFLFEGRVKLSPVYVNNLLIIGYDDKKIAVLVH